MRRTQVSQRMRHTIREFLGLNPTTKEQSSPFAQDEFKGYMFFGFIAGTVILSPLIFFLVVAVAKILLWCRAFVLPQGTVLLPSESLRIWLDQDAYVNVVWPLSTGLGVALGFLIWIGDQYQTSVYRRSFWRTFLGHPGQGRQQFWLMMVLLGIGTGLGIGFGVVNPVFSLGPIPGMIGVAIASSQASKVFAEYVTKRRIQQCLTLLVISVCLGLGGMGIGGILFVFEGTLLHLAASLGYPRLRLSIPKQVNIEWMGTQQWQKWPSISVSAININAVDDWGRTALHYAAIQDQAGAIASLLEHGAAIDLVDTYGDTALIHAIEHGSVQAVQVLVEGGANFSFYTPPSKPVELAARRGQASIVRHLLSVSLTPEIDSTLALREAIKENWPTTARVTIEMGANLDYRSPSGESLWEEASPQMLEILEEAR